MRRPPTTGRRRRRKYKSDVVPASLLQPRIAVVLGVPKFWHPYLFACRLLSIAPALWWGLRCALRFLITDVLSSSGYGYGSVCRVAPEQQETTSSQLSGIRETRLRLTETALSIIWCGASAYLAFIFTDCLMSRWLLNYTPQATIVRLFTLCCIFAYVSSQLIHLLGGDQSPSLLLPAWIGIATTLTLCYHVTQRKINIRKETSASIIVFSIASFISMVALLVGRHLGRTEGYGVDVPLVALLSRVGEVGGRLVVAVLGMSRENRGRDGL
ncbi:N-glycosylation protein-domain-containing protein [Xylariales sp. AK1849]|nr:N-glycosylation protein-domain-containing protein [Xylariales sp. AK1849]